MTNEEIVLKINDHEHEIGSLKHRVKDLEQLQNQIYELTMSVKELAISVKNMVAEQKEQGEKIKKLEGEDGEKWKLMEKTIITSIISALVGAAISALFLL